MSRPKKIVAHRADRSGVGIRRVAAVVAALTAAVVAFSSVVPAPAAQAATFTLTATRASSGTVAADAASTCATQGVGTPSTHCAGYDVSLTAVDQILRTGDSANVRFDFAFDGADAGVVLRSTLPESNGGAAAVWTALPPACAAGSTLSDASRTLNCLIANPPGAGDGSVTATLRLEARAFDGYTFTVPAQIQSNSSPVVPGASTAVFTSSSAPLWNIRKNVSANILPAPFFYRSATGEPGFAIPTSTGITANKVGGYSPLQGPVTWTETMTSAAVGVANYRLLNWGNYGDGCASQSQVSTPANPGYTGISYGISNQISPVAAGDYACVQPGGPGTPVQVALQNPPVAATGTYANMWLLLWVPIADIPVGTTPAPTLTVSGFDPNDVNGVNNFFAAAEPTADNARSHGNIINADNRAAVKRPISNATAPYAAAFPGANGSTTRDGSFISLTTFQNTGTVSQTPVQICDVIDVTTQRISPYATSGGLPADTYAVVTTSGPTGDPITAPPYQPIAGYNNTTNFGVDPSAYLIEYAAGELGGTTPTAAPLPASAFTGVTCADTGTATGWHTSPTDPAFATYAASLGLSDPLDVVNRVRVTFIGGAVEPGQMVGVKLHVTTRSVYRAATSQAGQTIFATTRIGDVSVYDYPQISIAPWTATAYVGPVVAGRIDVDTNVVVVSATPTNVQAGAPGQNRSTITLRASVAFGENVATTQPLRTLYYIAPGLRYVAGSASIVPDHVLPQAGGGTLLVWDLGDITGTTNGATVTPDWAFVVEADPLAPTPSVNRSTVVAESVSPTGAQIDLEPPAVACGVMLSLTIPPTPNVPVESVSAVPPPADYSGCFGQGRDRRMDWQPITIGNAFLSLGAYKTALQPLVESGADDGVAGAQVGWNLTYSNTTSNNFPGVDIIDVLPYPGDGRDPESDFSGTVSLQSVTTTDTLSVTPNLLPVSATIQPPRSGTTFYVTSQARATIESDPYATSNLQGGSTTWCEITAIGTPGCPATLGDATGLRIITGLLATTESETVRIGVATDGASADDIMTNTAVARVISVTTAVEISGDAIEFAASSLGGTVWADLNADGVLDAAETDRLANVTVTLTGTATTSGAAVNRTAVTAADGTYSFPGLPAGAYTVTVDQADARAVNAAYALTFDPDGVTSPDGSFSIVLPLGTDITGRNFGVGVSSLSGVVFADPDNDGVLEAGGAPAAGVDVTISGTDDLGDPVSHTALTAADGTYSFTGLRPGTYQVVITPPAGVLAGRSVPGVAGGTAGPLGSGTVSTVTVAAGQNAVGYLFGLLEPEVVSGSVFVDSDDDGIHDPGEAGIPGVTVTLGGDATLTTVTDADGRFAFGGLLPGDYTLTETQPAGFITGTNGTNGSVGSVAGDTFTGVVVGGGNDTDGYAFAELAMASLEGVVYHDLNANGVRDAGEPGIPGAQVTLGGDAAQGPVTTGANGTYRFDGLEPGQYTVTATEVTGYLDGLETWGTAGGTVAMGPGDNLITDIVLAAGENATGYLFGDVRAASLEGAVFEDGDGDGAQSAGESGIGGVSVTLTGTDMFGLPVNVSMSTLIDGSFSFTGLVPGTYVVTESQPGAYFDGIDTVGTAGGTVGADEVTAITLASGTSASGYLFAELSAVSLSGLVFADLDADGVQDGGETGISGVTIAIESSDGVTTDTVVTGADGSWTFTGLPPGTYTVTEQGQPLAGHIDGTSVAGTAGGSVAPNEISGIVLTAPADGYRFAEIPLSIIRGTVWHDADDDGVIDVGETPIAGVQVTLGGDATRTTVTGADGAFVFGGLAPGDYTITEEDLANWSDGATVLGGAGGTATVNSVTGITLGAGVDASGYGFGERAAELQLTVRAQTLDAQLATGPYVPTGSPVRLTYTVLNNGDTDIENIVVTDDVLGAITCPATVLAPHSSMECTRDTTAIAGQQLHAGEATADVVPSGPGPVVLAITDLLASDVAHYFGATAAATITAEAEGEGAGTAPGPVFPSGTVIDVAVTITNTGNVPLVLGALDTGGLGALDCGATATLAPGASIVCTNVHTMPPGNYAFALAMTLAGPDVTGVTGATAATAADALGTLFFQVLEPGVPMPDTTANTGVSIDIAAIAATGLVLLLLGGVLVVAYRRRGRDILT